MCSCTHKHVQIRYAISYVWCLIFNIYIVFTAWHRYFIVLPVLLDTLTTEKWSWYKGISIFVSMTIKILLDQSEYSEYLELWNISLCIFMFSRACQYCIWNCLSLCKVLNIPFSWHIETWQIYRIRYFKERMKIFQLSDNLSIIIYSLSGIMFVLRECEQLCIFIPVLFDTEKK